MIRSELRVSIGRTLSVLLLSFLLTACGTSSLNQADLQATLVALQTLAAPGQAPANSTPSSPATLPTISTAPAISPVTPAASAVPAARAPTASVPTGPVTPVAGHPRLWLRAQDLPRLRAWATDANPLYKNGLLRLATRAKQDMDSGQLQDRGSRDYEEYPSEMYSELFGFMSLVAGDQASRDDYAQRAHTLLMRVMNEAVKGPADGQPFRDPRFAASDSNRSRWWGEGFGLTVDWIYPYLSATDKATIRQVFLRWSNEIVQNSYHNPQPVNVLDNPVLVQNKDQLRWAGNNYFTAHMRNLGLMALALDPADDPGNQLGNFLRNAVGARLYMVDYLLRHDSRGGLAPEGFEYSPQTLAYVTQFMLALRTAGRDDPLLMGPEVSQSANPFWDDMLTSYLQSLSPAPVTVQDQGQVYQPAWYGDGQNYLATDFIGVFGPLGLYDRAGGVSARMDALRWVETNAAPGGAAGLADRVGRAIYFRDSILYFMLFDPSLPAPADPRPTQPLAFLAEGLGRILARTDWTPGAAWFTYKLGWNTIDHQHGDANMFEFYRNGEWLTKERTGYGLGSSDYHNTLALENSPPDHNEPTDMRHELWQRGSQWLYNPSGDGKLVAHSFGTGYVYVTGDATDLYNSEYEKSTDIVQASRSILWLEPDRIVVLDRAESKTAGRFKRFWLNLPTAATVSGNLVTMTTPKNQQLFVTSLLPSNAAIDVEPAEPMTDRVANYEPMKFRLRVEAPGGPQSVRFLHVLQGADAGAARTPTTLITSSAGTPYLGAQMGSAAVLFPANLSDTFAGVTFLVQSGTTTQWITGLAPNGGYDVAQSVVGGGLQMTIKPGTGARADSGGVLVIQVAK